MSRLANMTKDRHDRFAKMFKDETVDPEIAEARNRAQEWQGQSDVFIDRSGQMVRAGVNAGREMISAGRGLADRWGSRAEPLWNKISDKAGISPEFYANQASVDSNSAFDESAGVLERNMSRMGINPNSGRFQGLKSKWGLARAAAEAGSKTRARNSAEERAFLNLMNLMNVGLGQAGQGRNLMASGANQFNTAASQYGGLSDRYGGRAAEAQQFAEMRDNEMNPPPSGLRSRFATNDAVAPGQVGLEPNPDTVFIKGVGEVDRATAANESRFAPIEEDGFGRLSNTPDDDPYEKFGGGF